jgi:hypothetical protein
MALPVKPATSLTIAVNTIIRVKIHRSPGEQAALAGATADCEDQE